MSSRRILSLWFPRLAAERVLRAVPSLAGVPLAVGAVARGARVRASLTREAEAAGLRRGRMLGDARAICPGLVTRPEDARGTAGFLAALRRWAGRFSPWVAADGEGLVLDVTGCAHLFGGEAGLVAEVEAGTARMRLSLRLGLADTRGAAWAVARFAGAATGPRHAGDAIDQEARATRSRAQKRRWERGGPLPARAGGAGARIVPPGETLAHIGPLPVAALRIAPEAVAMLNGLGLRRIADVAVLPRAPLARRIGPEVAERLDQALGRLAEPVSPPPPDPVFAVRLTLPEPIGLEADVLAGVDRLLPPLCARLQAAGRGARQVRLTLICTDGRALRREVALMRAADRAEAIRPLLALRLEAVGDDLETGTGIEALRLEAVAVEPLRPRQVRAPASRQAGEAPEALADLLDRLGARLGVEALTRLHPADSHIPEKGDTVMAAGFSAPARGWLRDGPRPTAPRPLTIFAPEPLLARDAEVPPRAFVWRRRLRQRAAAFGPERIAPEWWLDDPAWRSGPRDYWRVETEEGTRIWIYVVRGAEAAPGWFAQGLFA